MAILASIHHVTRYQYDRPVVLSPQLVRLRPAPHCRTPILSYSQRITPALPTASPAALGNNLAAGLGMSLPKLVARML